MSKDNWPHKKADLISPLPAYTDWDQAKIDLKAKMTLYSWTLQLGSTVLIKDKYGYGEIVNKTWALYALGVLGE